MPKYLIQLRVLQMYVCMYVCIHAYYACIIITNDVITLAKVVIHLRFVY